MLDYTVVRQEVETLIDTNITTIPTVFENTVHEPVNVEHIEVYDDTNSAVPMDMSGDVTNVVGVITVAIFTQVGIGTQRAREIATLVEALFTSTAINGMSFGGSEFISAGYTKEGHLYQHNLVTQYQYFYGQDDSNSC